MKKILATILLSIGLLTTTYAQSALFQGGTGWSTSTRGDLLVGTTSNQRYTRLPVGSTGNVLWVLNGQPAWVATSSLGFSGSGTVTSVSVTTPTGLTASTSTCTTACVIALSLTGGYIIPLTASTTEWATAYASTTNITPSWIRSLFSNTATGLTYNSSTGGTSLTSGYVIPLTASTTEWSSFYTTPSTRITAGANCSWAGNTFNCTGGSGGTFSTTSINGLATTTFTFSTSSDTNITLAIATSSSGINFIPGWSGVLSTSRGGTGTSTPAQQGYVLVGLADGTWSPQPTSTLGFTGGGTVYTGTYPIIVSGSVISSGFSTSTVNVFTDLNTFNATTTMDKIKALTSAGLMFFSNSNTPIADFGAGGGSNATFYGGVTVNGQTSLTTASSTAQTINTLYVPTSAFLQGLLHDSTNASGTGGQVLLSTGTSTLWTSTSSLGISGSLSGGTAGYLTYWTSPTTVSGVATGSPGTLLQASSTSATGYDWVSTSSLGIVGGGGVSGSGVDGYTARWSSPTAITTGKFIDNGTVTGVNATSSTYTTFIQGNSATSPLGVASSTGTVVLGVSNLDRVGIGTGTPASLLHLVGGALSLENSQEIRWRQFGSSAFHRAIDVDTGDNLNIARDDDIQTIQLVGDTNVLTSTADPTARIVFRPATTGANYFNTTGNFGIGTSTAGGKLVVQGAAGSLNPLIIASSTGNPLFAIAATGRVGVATSTMTAATFNVANSGSDYLADFRKNDTSGTGIRVSRTPSSSGAFIPFYGTFQNTTAYSNPAATNMIQIENQSSGANNFASANLRVASFDSNVSAVFAGTADTGRLAFGVEAYEGLSFLSTGMTGFGTTTPVATLQVTGAALNQSSSNNTISRGLFISPNPTNAASTLSATDYRGLEVAGYTFVLASSTALSNAYGSLFNAPTIATTSATTLRSASTVYISGAPKSITNVLISSSSALTIGGGTVSSTTNAYSIFANAPTGATNNWSFATNGRLTVATSSPTPTLSSCGTSPSIRGSDWAGVVTVGSSATGCTITFASAYPSEPTCTVTNQSMSVVNAMTYVVTATEITVTQTGLGGSKLNYHCVGLE